MRIGFITPEYPFLENKAPIGGIGTFTKNLAALLVQRGHKVCVFIPNQENNQNFVEYGVHIYRIQIKKVKGLTWFLNRLHFNKTVNSIIEQEKLQVIEAPEWTGFTAFMKFKCPLIIRLHGSDTYFCKLENRPVKKKNYFFEKAALQGADQIIGVSNFVAEQTKQLFKINQPIAVIHNFIDTNSFEPNHQNIIPHSILYFGTLIRKKGVLSIAKMLNVLVQINTQFSMTFVGRDTIDYLTKTSTKDLILKELSVQAKQKVTFIDAVSYEKIQQYLKNTELIVLPSLAEAFPMTWLEAMAMEKKMITSNIGWANELMIDGKTGYTISPENSEIFAKKVNNILCISANNHLFGKNARYQIQNKFDSERGIEKNEHLYQSVIASK